jgi:hypothetical protein
MPIGIIVPIIMNLVATTIASSYDKSSDELSKKQYNQSDLFYSYIPSREDNISYDIHYIQLYSHQNKNLYVQQCIERLNAYKDEDRKKSIRILKIKLNSLQRQKNTEKNIALIQYYSELIAEPNIKQGIRLRQEHKMIVQRVREKSHNDNHCGYYFGHHSNVIKLYNTSDTDEPHCVTFHN